MVHTAPLKDSFEILVHFGYCGVKLIQREWQEELRVVNRAFDITVLWHIWQVVDVYNYWIAKDHELILVVRQISWACWLLPAGQVTLKPTREMARHRDFVTFLKVGHGLYYRTPYLSPITQVPWSACDPLYPVCDRLQTGSEFPLISFPCFHFDGWSVDHYLSNILRTVWGQFAHISWKLKVARILDGYYSLIRGRPPLGVEQLLLTSNGLEKCLRWRNYQGVSHGSRDVK